MTPTCSKKKKLSSQTSTGNFARNSCGSWQLRYLERCILKSQPHSIFRYCPQQHIIHQPFNMDYFFEGMLKNLQSGTHTVQEAMEMAGEELRQRTLTQRERDVKLEQVTMLGSTGIINRLTCIVANCCLQKKTHSCCNWVNN